MSASAGHGSTRRGNADSRIREREAEIVLANLPLGRRFDRVLEVGSGAGAQLPFLGRLGGKVFPSDLVARFEHGAERFVVCSAERLPYRAGVFDLLFSSNVLEHVVEKRVALAEMCRVASREALFIHVVPTSFWKLLYLVTFYPYKASEVLRQLRQRCGGRRLPTQGGATEPRTLTRARRTLGSVFVPEIHGTSRTHGEEFVDLREATWRRLFEESGLAVDRVVPLLSYSPNVHLVPPNRLLARLGFASTIAYFLRRREPSKVTR